MYIKKAISVLLTFLIILCSMSISPYAYEDKPKIWSGKTADSFAGGDGTEESPYQIETAEQLALFGEIVNSNTDENAQFNAELTDDIYLNKTEDWEFWGTENYNDKKLNEWTPINIEKEPAIKNGFFIYSYTNTVNFNGNNHTIYGMYINKPDEDFIGLFSTQHSAETTITNIIIKDSYICGRDYVGGIVGRANNIDNCTVFASIQGNSYVGGISGYCDDKIFDCSNNGAVSGNSDYVGGISGYCDDKIFDCSNNGAVSGNSDYVGGISGYCRDKIFDCSNNGAVSGNSDYVGGIVGDTYSVEMCYNKGIVNGSNYVGGISGKAIVISYCYNWGKITGKESSRYIGGISGYGLANRCYNTGSVTGAGDIGPICGKAWVNLFEFKKISSFQELINMEFLEEDPSFSGTSNCYYLDDNTLYSDKTNAANAIPLTSEQMSKYYCYNNWDFENIWTIPGNGSYPQFIKDTIIIDDDRYNQVRIWDGKTTEPFISDSEHTGNDENHPYLIENVEQLAYLAKKVNAGEHYTDKYFKLENDIKINNTNIEHWTAYAADWGSIGNGNDISDDETAYFGGCFDGNGHYISGLKQMSFTNIFGLFGVVSNGTIKNISIKDSYIFGEDNVGGICGKSENSVYENCSFSGLIYARDSVGGIVGEGTSCSFIKCHNKSNIFAEGGTGGIVGSMEEGGGIYLSYNTGRIIGYLGTGGIVGGLSSNIYVVDKNFEDKDSEISQCYNSGYVYALMYAGGIVGAAICDKSIAEINNCYNSGNICCSYLCEGGIAGVLLATDIYNCYNCGMILIESEESQVIDLQTIYANIGNGIVTGCIASIVGASTIKNSFFLKNKNCKFGTNLQFLSKVYNVKSLSAEEMQNENSFPKSWFSDDGVWTLTEGNEEYLFPQLKGLPHVPGNEYSFSYVSAENGETKIASASPYVFSNTLNYFSPQYRMDGIYEELFDSLLNNNTQNKVLAKAEVELYKMLGSIYGHCFGMSAVMALYMSGLIDINNYQWQAKSPFDFLNPVNSNTIESLINYFQLCQNINTILSKKNRPRNRIASDLIEALKTNDCVLLGLCFYVDTENGKTIDYERHCVVAYNNGKLTKDGETIGIWDPNHSQNVTGMTIEKADSDSYNVIGSNTSDKFYLEYVVTVEDLEPAYNLLNDNISSLNLNSYSPGKVETNSDLLITQSEQDNSAVTLITSYDNFKITDNNNKTATVLYGEVQESSTLEMSNGIIISENADLPLRQFELPQNSSSYTITPLESNHDSDTTLISSEKDKWYSIVNSEGLAEINFNLAKKEVTTDSDEKINQKISSGYEDAKTSWDNIEIQCSAEGICKKIDENSCCLSTDSDTETTIIVSDGINETNECNIKTEQNKETVISEIMNVGQQNSRQMEINNQNKEILGYTVFFVSGTDEYNKSVSVEPGKTVSEPEAIKNPERSMNYIFKGWYTEDGRKWNFKEDTVNSNIRLIAKWEEIKIEPQISMAVTGRKAQMNVSGIDNFDRITWNSLNGKTASVDSNSGLALFKKRGISTIVATVYIEDSIYEAQYNLRVYNPVEYVVAKTVEFFKNIFKK